jgi:adenylyl- and sulfurtransferase ThiI
MNILAIVEDSASQYQLARFSILGRLYIVMITRVCERSLTKARGCVLRRSFVRAWCRRRCLCCLLNGQNIDDLAGQTINGDERGEYTNIFVGILVNLLYKSFTKY